MVPIDVSNRFVFGDQIRIDEVAKLLLVFDEQHSHDRFSIDSKAQQD